jgi:creatinine amidohydrolase
MKDVSVIDLGRLTRSEFAERMDGGSLGACIIPVGATEQHLEHLAMEHDVRSVLLVAHAVAKMLSPRVLVAPAVAVGVSEHHMIYPGTLSLRPATFLAVVTDLIESVVRAGFRNILVLNGHGGNAAPCKGVWDQLLRLSRVNLQFLSYWDVLEARDARSFLKAGHRLPEDLPGHAREFETALALALFPENVRREVLAAQEDPRARSATAEAGQALFERIVQRVADHVKEMMEGRRKAEAPVFEA